MRFKIDWARLIFGSKFTVFALFYFVFESNFRSTSPRGAYIWRGDLTEGFLRYRFGCLYWRRLFSEFYGASSTPELHFKWQSLAAQANTPAPLVQKLDSAINWMNLHLVDNPIGLPSTYPLNIDLPVE